MKKIANSQRNSNFTMEGREFIAQHPPPQRKGNDYNYDRTAIPCTSILINKNAAPASNKQIGLLSIQRVRSTREYPGQTR